jgi:hypothetical protein
MNRKQLEECAWKKTPRDERRDRVEQTKWSMRTGQVESTTFRKLTGNSREVLVFDPSGTTEGTINAWVPLWSLYGDELEQRCKEGRLPKLRAPYNRMRADYTGDVESSPGTTATREGASRHHATKKKSPAQLQREIDEVLTAPRNTDVDHPEYVSAGALRGFGRQAFHRGYTIEGANTFAEAAVGRRLDEAELDVVVDGWNAERTLKKGSATSRSSSSKRSHATKPALRWDPAVRGRGEVTARSGYRAFVQPVGTGKWHWEVKPVGYEMLDPKRSVGTGTASSKAAAKAAASRLLLSQL